MFRNYDMFAASRSVPVPTFAATGRYDFIVPHTSWEACRDIPNLSVNVFDKAGHTPQLESPKEFDEKLLGWLASPRSASSRHVAHQ
jgi:proline iminopeptidase